MGVGGDVGIRFFCPNGHKLNVKDFQAGRKGICPFCGAKVQIPTESTRPPSKRARKSKGKPPPTAGAPPEGTIPVATPVSASGGSPPAGPSASQPSSAIAQSAPIPDQPGEQAPVGGQPAPGFVSEASAQSWPVAVPQDGPPPVSPGVGPAMDTAAAPSTPPADPLAEAGNVVWYVRPVSGGQFGPAGSEVMRTWLEEGRIGADSLVWREGWRDWQEAAAVFPELGAGQAGSPLGSIAAGPTAAGASARGGGTRARRRSNTNQAVVIVLLVFAVIILSGVFLWVLFREHGGQVRDTARDAPTVIRQPDSLRPRAASAGRSLSA